MNSWPSRSPVPWLLFLVAVCTHAAEQPGNYTLTIQGAWQAHLKPGVSSELSVLFMAAHGGEARLILKSSLSQIDRDFQFRPGEPFTLVLPVAHDSTEPVAVEIYIQGELAVRKELQLHMLPPSATVAAQVGGQSSISGYTQLLQGGGVTALHIAADELPRRGQSYAVLSALALSSSALGALDDSQRRALNEYIGGCGLLYLTDVPHPEESVLRAVAGCGSRNLIVSRPGSTSSAQPETISQLPGAPYLRLLDAASPAGVQRSIVVLLIAYVLLLVLMARSARTPLPLLVLPLAATALALLGWSFGSPSSRVGSWAQMDSGDTVARFSGLVQIAGMSRTSETLSLPPTLGLPLPSEGGQPMKLHFREATVGFDLRVETLLLSRHEFMFTGVVPGLPLAVLSHASGARIINHGSLPSVPGVLAWQGQRYTVPILGPGQEWAPPTHREPWGGTAQEQMLRQRASTGGTWLLVPFSVPSLQLLADEMATDGWLLIRGVVDA